jgi:hypothetical protein
LGERGETFPAPRAAIRRALSDFMDFPPLCSLGADHANLHRNADQN